MLGLNDDESRSATLPDRLLKVLYVPPWKVGTGWRWGRLLPSPSPKCLPIIRGHGSLTTLAHHTLMQGYSTFKSFVILKYGWSSNMQ
jgi:hypothetical protein